MSRDCLTPGAIYSSQIKSKLVSMTVTLPEAIPFSLKESCELEEEIHDAMEKILAPYFKRKS